MDTRKWIAWIGGVLVLAALTSETWAQGGRPDRRTAPPPEGIGRPTAPPPDGIRPPGTGPGTTSQPAVALSFSGEYAEMVNELKLNANQQKFLGTVVKEEEKSLANFDRDNKKQLDDLNKSLDGFNKRLADPNRFNADANNARATVQAAIARVVANREKLSRNFKVRAMGTFTPDQKATWIGLKLNRILSEELAPLSLSAEQQTAVRTLCDREAKSVTEPDVAANTTLQDSVRQQISAGVLTEEQRTRYAQILAERQAKKPT